MADGVPDSLDRRALMTALQAVADGDFSVRLPGDWTGLEGKIADRFNDIVAANQKMAEELARVGQVVGREGKTRQRMRFARSGGAWGEMQVSFNTLIDDLVRPTTEVTRAVTAVAQGNLLQTVRLDVEGRPLEGEFLRSATIVNTMIKQLSVFTSEVTRVAREVGTDGKLGGQAQVPEVSGVWKDLTESVNLMASNLTAQVRNISEVTIAVASGDLSRKITVDVRGEILQLKEAINTMVDQLRGCARDTPRFSRNGGGADRDYRLGRRRGPAVVAGGRLRSASGQAGHPQRPAAIALVARPRRRALIGSRTPVDRQPAGCDPEPPVDVPKADCEFEGSLRSRHSYFGALAPHSPLRSTVTALARAATASPPAPRPQPAAEPIPRPHL